MGDGELIICHSSICHCRREDDGRCLNVYLNQNIPEDDKYTSFSNGRHNHIINEPTNNICCFWFFCYSYFVVVVVVAAAAAVVYFCCNADLHPLKA